MFHRRALYSLLFVLFGFALGNAQAAEAPEPRAISVSGSAVRLVAPDQVGFRLMVEGRGETAKQALEQAGKRVGTVLRALGPRVEPEQIKALNTDLRKVVKDTDRSWVRDRGEPQEMLATRTLQIQRVPIARLAEIMDAIAAEPLARVNSVTPVVSTARKIEDELQIEAAEDARQRAQKLATALGVNLGLPLQVDVSNVQRPQPQMMRSMEASMMKVGTAGSGYDKAGQEEIRAQLRIRFELLPKNP